MHSLSRSYRFPRGQGRIAATTLVVSVMLVIIWITARVSCSQTGEARGTKWVCEHYPERVNSLLQSLNLNRPELASVRDAVDRNDPAAACDALLAYYQSCPQTIKRGRPVPTPTGAVDETAERVLDDQFDFYRVVRRVPRRDDGGLDWTYNGPNNDREWGWAFNNLYHLVRLSNGYFRTGSEPYVDRISVDVTDWVTSNPFPGRASSTPQWRGLQASARVEVWADIFYRLQHAEAFTPAARILILTSLPDHAHYLMLFHREKGNIAVNEMKGLAMIGALWPEFIDAAGWRRYAAEIMAREINEQVYPDGAQTELTSLYHRIATNHFETFANIMGEFGRMEADTLLYHVEKMWNYTAYTMRPDGFAPMNNDSDHHEVRKILHAAAATYKRDDWLYIATNGLQGMAPPVASVVFPWAGHVIMRDGWKENAQWSFFDAGPWGTAHQHDDKLHLSVSAFGRDLLVDSGRYTYDAGPFREYFVGTRAHNALLIDHKSQNPGVPSAVVPLDSTSWLLTPDFDFARGTFNDGYESLPNDVTNTRSVLYVRGEFWVVLDHIETDRARDVTAMWHFHPSCSVVLDGETVKSDDEGAGNLRIVPASGLALDVEIVGGMQGSAFQGWYSEKYGNKLPNPTAVYESRVSGPSDLVWVLVPARGQVPPVTAMVSARDGFQVVVDVRVSGAAPYRITIPRDDKRPTVTRLQ